MSVSWSPACPWFPPRDFDMASFVCGLIVTARVEDVFEDHFVVRVWSNLHNATVTFRRDAWTAQTAEQRVEYLEGYLGNCARAVIGRSSEMQERLRGQKKQQVQAAKALRRKR